MRNGVAYRGSGSSLVYFNGTSELDADGGSWFNVSGGFSAASGLTVLGLGSSLFDEVGSLSGDVWFGPDFKQSAYAQISSNYTQPLYLCRSNRTCGLSPPVPPKPPLPISWCSGSPHNVHFLTGSVLSDSNPNVPLPAPIPPFPLPAVLYAALQLEGCGLSMDGSNIEAGWLVAECTLAQVACPMILQDGQSSNGGVKVKSGAYRASVTLQSYTFSFGLTVPLIDLNVAAIQIEGVQSYGTYDVASWSGDPSSLDLSPSQPCRTDWDGLSPPQGPCWNPQDNTPSLGHLTLPASAPAWMFNPNVQSSGSLPKSAQQGIDWPVLAVCAGTELNCSSNSSLSSGQASGALWFDPVVGNLNITVDTNNTAPGLTHYRLDLAIIGQQQNCSSYSVAEFDEFGRFLRCFNQSFSGYPNGTLQGGSCILLDTTTYPNVTVISSTAVCGVLDLSGTLITDGNVTFEGTPARAVVTANSGTRRVAVDVLLEPGTCMLGRIAGGSTYFDNSGVCTLDSLSGDVTTAANAPITRTVSGQQILFGWNEQTTINNPIDSPTCSCNSTTSQTTNTEKIQNPTAPCTDPVVFTVPPVVTPCPPPPPPAPDPQTNPSGGRQSPGACVGSCGFIPGGSTTGSSSSTTGPGSTTGPPGGSTGTPTTGPGGSSTNTPGGSTTSPGGSSTGTGYPGGSTTNRPSSTGPVSATSGWGWKTTPEPPTWQIPVIAQTLSLPCTPGSEYLDSLTDQFLDCNSLGVWEAREYSCPLGSVCANSSIINGVPFETVVNTTDLGNGTKQFDIGLYYNWTEAAYCPACGIFTDNSGRGYFNQTWVYNPVVNIVFQEPNGSQVVMHNNVTLSCVDGVVCSVTESTDPSTNLTNSALSISLDNPLVVEAADPNILVTTNSNGTYFVGLNGQFFPNGSNVTGVGITNIYCGQGLDCPENGTSVYVTLTGFVNGTFSGTTYINGTLVLNGVPYMGMVPSFSVSGGSQLSGVNLDLLAGANLGVAYASGGHATFSLLPSISLSTVQATDVLASPNSPLPFACDPGNVHFDNNTLKFYVCFTSHTWRQLGYADLNVPSFSVNGGTTHAGVDLNLRSGSGVVVTKEGAPGDVVFDAAPDVLRAGSVVNATFVPLASEATLNVTYQGQNYYIPSGVQGLTQVEASFSTRFRWGTLLSDPVVVNLVGLGSSVSVFVAPFIFVTPPAGMNRQPLIVASDPLPFGFGSQLASGAQSGSSVSFVNLALDAVQYFFPAVPYINWFQRIVFSAQDAYFGQNSGSFPNIATFGGLRFSYLTQVGAVFSNCSNVHWDQPSSFVDMGDVQVGHSVSVTVNLINSGARALTGVAWTFRNGVSAGWTVTATTLGGCVSGLAPGASCPATVTYAASAADGYHGAALSASYACDGQTYELINTINEVGFQANAVSGPVTTPPPTTTPPPGPSTSPPALNGSFIYTSNWGPGNVPNSVEIVDARNGGGAQTFTFQLGPWDSKNTGLNPARMSNLTYLTFEVDGFVGEPYADTWYVHSSNDMGNPSCDSLPGQTLVPGVACSLAVGVAGCGSHASFVMRAIYGYPGQGYPLPEGIYLAWRITAPCPVYTEQMDGGVAAWSGGPAVAAIGGFAGGAVAAAIGGAPRDRRRRDGDDGELWPSSSASADTGSVRRSDRELGTSTGAAASFASPSDLPITASTTTGAARSPKAHRKQSGGKTTGGRARG